jgi:MYXO-CTERM domain-containing protein
MRAVHRFSAGLIALAALGTSTFAHAASHGLQTFVGDAVVPVGATAHARARSVIVQRAPWSAGLELRDARVTNLSSGDRLVRFAQTHLGVPVVHGGAVVTFGPAGETKHVAVALQEDLPASVTPQIDATAAAAIATKNSGLEALSSDATLAIYPTADGAVLTWVVYAKPMVGVPYAPVVVVSAITGEVILSMDAMRNLNHASVYPTNPVKSPMLTDVTLPVDVGKTTLENTLIQSLNCIDQKHTKMLMGFAVHVCDLLQTATPDMNGDYTVAPGMDKDPEDAFSEVSMFYHANRAYSYFRQFDDKLSVNGNQALPTVSNLRIPQGFQPLDPTKLGDVNLPLQSFQNAFFAPSNPLFDQVFGFTGGAMWFGQGPLKDYSYDGDVVYHEFTHSVVNVTLKLVQTHMDEYGTSYSPGAMNEGLADYFSSAIAGDPDVGEYATQDFAPGSTAIRTLDNKDTCPSAVGGEVHQDSTLFSGALWDARKALSPADQVTFDGAIFKAMNSSPTGDLGYEQFAKLAHDAVAASSLGKSVADALDAAFTAHGVLPRCTRILDYADKPLSGPKDLQGLFWGPGTQTTGVKLKSGSTAGVVQVHYPLPANTGKVDVEISTVDVGGGQGGGTPFAGVVYARFAKDPIQFTYKPMALNDGTSEIVMTKAGAKFTATIDVPAGSTEAYLMIGNKGQSDGAYTKLTLTATPGTTTGAGGGGVGGGGSTTASSSSSSGAGGSAAQPTEIGGCGCSTPGDTTSNGAIAVAIAALGLAISRRRRAV